MNIDNVRQLLEERKYPQNLIDWAIKLYPQMCDYFGENNVISLFKEFEFIPRNRTGNNSGATDREQKKIEFDWSLGNQHEALTLLIHEAAHALGILQANDDSILMEADEYNESFVKKLEEGFVCDKQNELEFGELNYTYVTINTFDDEEFHLNNFKTQPSTKYCIPCVYYKCLQLLLGANKNLIYMNMFSKNKKEKQYLYGMILQSLANELTADELRILKDCVCSLIINYGYRGQTQTWTDEMNKYIQSHVDISPEEAKQRYIDLSRKEWFPKSYSYALERNLLNEKIFDSVDKLCGLTIDILRRRLNDKNYNANVVIKDAASYFVKVCNTSDKLNKQTICLKNDLIKKMAEVEINLSDINNLNNNLSSDDIFELVAQLLSLPYISINDLNSIDFTNINNTGFNIILNEIGEFSVKKELIYNDDDYFDNTPVGYRFITTCVKLSKNISLDNSHAHLK